MLGSSYRRIDTMLELISDPLELLTKTIIKGLCDVSQCRLLQTVYHLAIQLSEMFQAANTVG